MRYAKACIWFAVACLMFRVAWWYAGHTEDPLGALMALAIAAYATVHVVRLMWPRRYWRGS